jgi:hypothetical protein
MSRCCGSRLDNSRLCTSRLLLGTLLRRPLAHSFVHFVRCVTGHAAHDSAREGAVTAQMACYTASNCACDAAFGDGDTWGERIVRAKSEVARVLFMLRPLLHVTTTPFLVSRHGPSSPEEFAASRRLGLSEEQPAPVAAGQSAETYTNGEGALTKG